jgi:RNase P subunit RPR2
LSPQRITCAKCGEPLYTGIELETPIETIQRLGGYCPKCGKKLGFAIENLKIQPQTSPPPR